MSDGRILRFVITRARDILTNLDSQVFDVEDGAITTPADVRIAREPCTQALMLTVESQARRRSATSQDVLSTASEFATWPAS